MKKKQKNSYVPRSLEEDPNQFHAKPRDLARDASDMPVSSSGTYSNDSNVFSGNCKPFTAFGLETRLAEHINGENADGLPAASGEVVSKGLGLKQATRAQSLIFPVLIPEKGRNNVLLKSQTGSGKTMVCILINSPLLLLQNTQILSTFVPNRHT